jgi:hypothetical protein
MWDGASARASFRASVMRRWRVVLVIGACRCESVVVISARRSFVA